MPLYNTLQAEYPQTATLYNTESCTAMLSLSSSQVHPDLELVFLIIENGGRKAKGVSNTLRYIINTLKLIFY
jgi:hypothetical protein